MNDHRSQKLSSTLLRALQEIGAKGFSDPRLDGCILTFTEIDLSPDGKNAKVHVSVLPDKAQKKALAALQHASRHIRHALGDKLDMRLTPELFFALDVRLKRQAGVMGALGKVVEDRIARGLPEPQSQPQSPLADAGAEDQDDQEPTR